MKRTHVLEATINRDRDPQPLKHQVSSSTSAERCEVPTVSIAKTAISGLVSRDRFDRIERRTPSDDAQESVERLATTTALESSRLIG